MNELFTNFELANFDNSTYTLSFSLSTVNEIYALKKTAIRYLEIVCNVSQFGETGTVIFDVPNNTLTQIGALSLDNQSTINFNIFIRTNDLDTTLALEDEKAIKIITQLQKSQQNIEDNTIQPFVFSFEEITIANLKQTQYIDATVQPLGEALINTITVNKSTNYTEPSAEIKVDIADIIDYPSVVSTLENDESYYDYSVKLLRAACNNDGPTHIHLHNYEGDRVFEVVSLGTEIRRVCEEIEANNFTSIFEVFTTSPNDTNKLPNIFRSSVVDKYKVFTPDYTSLLNSKWVDYKLVQSTNAETAEEVVTYNEMRQYFKDNVCGGREPSLPVAPEENRRVVKYEMQYGDEADRIIIRNAMMRSFIFDNTTIVLRVPGLPARTSGEFILINNVNSESKSSINGLWFVTSVRHIIESELYVNEITAVKFLTLNNSVYI